jgi:hypothetical protein
VVLFVAVVVLIGPSFALLFSLKGRHLLHSPEPRQSGSRDVA